MNNLQILQKWDKNNDPNKIDFSNVYTSMFINRDQTVDDLLKQFGLKKNWIIASEDEDINLSLIAIDQLMDRSADIIKEFVLETVFSDIDPTGLMEEFKYTNTRLSHVYEEIEGEFKFIKKEIDG